MFSNIFVFSPLSNRLGSSQSCTCRELFVSLNNDSSDLSDEFEFLVSVDSCKSECLGEVSAHSAGIVQKLLVSVDFLNCMVQSESLNNDIVL